MRAFVLRYVSKFYMHGDEEEEYAAKGGTERDHEADADASVGLGGSCAEVGEGRFGVFPRNGTKALGTRERGGGVMP